jgi:alpha-galactosidase
VRTPLIVLQFWRGNWIGAQDVSRRWMMAHSMPLPGGELPAPQLLASSSRQYEETLKANGTNQFMLIDRYTEEGIKLDYWWMDAGWYVNYDAGWPRVGTWEVDINCFPHVSDAPEAPGCLRFRLRLSCLLLYSGGPRVGGSSV